MEIIITLMQSSDDEKKKLQNVPRNVKYMGTSDFNYNTINTLTYLNSLDSNSRSVSEVKIKQMYEFKENPGHSNLDISYRHKTCLRFEIFCLAIFSLFKKKIWIRKLGTPVLEI